MLREFVPYFLVKVTRTPTRQKGRGREWLGSEPLTPHSWQRADKA